MTAVSTGPLTPAGLEQPAFIRVLEPQEVAGSALRADGVLAGLPFAVKDNIDVAGVRLVGKTNMDQFATGLVGTRSPYGACHSVYSADHISGGSSSGSAVAVASGQVDFALGTDTAGSG